MNYLFVDYNSKILAYTNPFNGDSDMKFLYTSKFKERYCANMKGNFLQKDLQG